ncbi:Protein Mon2-like protein [Gracilaria domingensis]|nr:Protein Mon2-like protein [Gracilaria domingensis]
MALVSRADADAQHARAESWCTIYAIEALRCIFRATPNQPSPLIDFVRAFDLAHGKCVSSLIAAVNNNLALVESQSVRLLPAPPIAATMKPFAKLIANTPEFIVAIAVGLYVEIVKAADEAMQNQLFDVTGVFLPTDVTMNIVAILARLVQHNASPPNLAELSAADQDAQMTAFECVVDSIAKIAVVSDACNFDDLREKAITTLCAACAQSARSKPAANEVAIAGRQLQCLYKALFNVAARCKTSLGRAWEPVIDALDQLDALNEKSSAIVDRDTKAFASSARGLEDDLRALMSSTSELPWDSCHDLISALVRCSRQSVAQMGKKGNGDESVRLSPDSSGSVRLFGIVGAEIAILSALRRTDSGEASVPSALWQLLTGHLTSICVDTPSQSLRVFALASLTRIACGALQDECNIIIAHERIVRPFMDLLSSPYADVHSGTLSSVYSILETHGEQLKGDAAWRIILQILGIATGTKSQRSGDLQIGRDSLHANGTPSNFEASPETVSDGFKLVQFIADDFLSSITKSSFPVWLNLLGLCSSQVHDVNVALTSIGLMWRTADFIAKVGEVGKDDDLWVALFQVLKEVSMDDRPEIRNCAVKTLTGALSAHSSRLSAVAWNGCVEKALLPLLEEVMQGGSATSAEEPPALGKSRSDVQLLLHHSRDTPRKQWNETRVLALAGVAKLLRTAMPRLSVLKDENNRPLFMMLTDGGTGGLWRKMLRAAGVAAASRDGEVAVAGVSALLELLNAAGLVVERPSASAPELHSPNVERSSSLPKPSSSSFWIPSFVGSTDGEESNVPAEDPEETKRVGTVSLWEAVWCALSEATGGRQLLANDSSPKSTEKKLEVVDERALRILSEGLISARKRLADKFTPSSSRVLVEVLMVLSLGRQTSDAARSVGPPEGVSKVQDVTLQGLEELSFGNDEASWSALIEGMLGIVSRDDISGGSRDALSTRILQLLSRMYQSDETPAAVKASQTANVLRVLGKIMVSSSSSSAYAVQGRNLVNGAESSGVNMKERDEENGEPLWIQATEVVIIAMKRGSEERGTYISDEIWQEFAKLVTDMLFKERKRGFEKNYGTSDRERREANDMRLVECVKDGLSRMGSNTSGATKQNLVRILARGAEEGQTRGRPRRNVESAETCSRVLGQYNADGHRSGKCPLPAGRRAEAVFLLQQLRKMRRTDRWAQHVTYLYARLCECVDSRDEAVRWLAKELLDESAPITQETDVNKVAFRTSDLRV